jgi:hypothetical protein
MCRINKQEKITKICNFSFVTFCGLFILSTVARIYFYNDLAVKNQDLKSSYDNQALLEEEITALRYEDSRLSSVAFIEAEAFKKGFVVMKDRLVSLDISTSGQVASLAR